MTERERLEKLVHAAVDKAVRSERHFVQCIVDALEKDRQAPPAPTAKSHPEDTCQQCGGCNVIWWVDCETWQSVMHGEGVVCPTCFMLKAIEVVGPVTWRVSLDAEALTEIHRIMGRDEGEV